MFLESHITESTILQIACETDNGIHKAGSGVHSGHPDRVLGQMKDMIGIMHHELAMKVLDLGVAEAEIEFGLQMDPTGNVILALTPDLSQVRVKLKVAGKPA